MRFWTTLWATLLVVGCVSAPPTHPHPYLPEGSVLAAATQPATAPAGRTYTRTMFRGSATAEACELVGLKDISFVNCTFIGGKTGLRCNNCEGITVSGCTFSGQTGPADPDGQCIQFIRTTGTIKNCSFTATRQSEDLISIFADGPVAGTVTIDTCNFVGRGRSASCTSVCLDGKFCPPTTVTGCRITNARCGVTVAGGIRHTVTNNTFYGCDSDVYLQNFYGGDFGFVTVIRNRLQNPILRGGDPGHDNNLQLYK